MLILHQDINYNKYYLKYKLNITFNNKTNWVNRAENNKTCCTLYPEQ